MSHLSAIITFNTEKYFEKQVELFRKHVAGDILLVDNSTDFNISRQLKKMAEKLKTDYVKTAVNENDFSRSHAYACTVAYQMAEGYYTLLLSDHDIFPIKWFHLPADTLLGGIYQVRVAPDETLLEYMQPALLFMNLKYLKGIKIDFNPCVVLETYLDTGGGLYSIVMGNKNQCVFFDERHEVSDGFEYSSIDDTWIHLRNGSNWKQDDDHDERINKLLNILP